MLRRLLNFLREVNWWAVAGFVLLLVAFGVSLVAVVTASLVWGIPALVLALAGLALFIRS